MWHPLNGRVIIKPAKAKEETKEGIIIPEQAKEKPCEGEIIAVSEQEHSVQVGSKVLYSKYAGTEILIDEAAHLLMDERDILAVQK